VGLPICNLPQLRTQSSAKVGHAFMPDRVLTIQYIDSNVTVSMTLALVLANAVQR